MINFYLCLLKFLSGTLNYFPKILLDFGDTHNVLFTRILKLEKLI